MRAGTVSPDDRLSLEAVLVLVGAIVHIVGRYLMEGNTGLVIAGVGFCAVWGGVVLYYWRQGRKSITR